MPASFARRGAGEPPTLREILNYHAYDDSRSPMSGGSSAPFKRGWMCRATRPCRIVSSDSPVATHTPPEGRIVPVVEFRFARFRSGLTLTETLGR
jgi:hypothetical protein